MDHRFVAQAPVAELDIDQTFVNVQLKIIAWSHVLSKVHLVQYYPMANVPQMVFAVTRVCYLLGIEILNEWISFLESCQIDETCSMSSNQNVDSLQEQSHVL
jgi:hypothetical protein